MNLILTFVIMMRMMMDLTTMIMTTMMMTTMMMTIMIVMGMKSMVGFLVVVRF